MTRLTDDDDHSITSHGESTKGFAQREHVIIEILQSDHGFEGDPGSGQAFYGESSINFTQASNTPGGIDLQKSQDKCSRVKDRDETAKPPFPT
jgi:hypothetical protein